MKAPFSQSRRHRLVPMVASLALELAVAAPVAAKTPADISALLRLADPIGNGRGALARPPNLSAAIASRRIATSKSSAPRRPATTLPVTSCADDGGLGTLRHVVLTAVSGDTVDLSALTCGTITLQSGAVHVDVDDLTVQGPGPSSLAIDGNAADRVFTHSGAGTLTITGLTVTHGTYTADKAWGGCLFSRGSLALTNAVVSGCTASGATAAVGGGLAAYGDISLISSLVSGNTAAQTNATPSQYSGAYGGGVVSRYHLDVLFSTVSGNEAAATAANAYGGGAVAIGFTQVKYSTFDSNTASTPATSPGSYYGVGGGLDVMTGGALIANSTIESNHADLAAGFVFAFAVTPQGSVTIKNSTVSGNVARFEAGGGACGADLTLSNSTIAFNEAGSYGGGGLLAAGDTLDLESSIIADNTPSGSLYPADLGVGPTTAISGANNLVKITDAAVPPDTINADPMLGLLQDNGGTTHTHALLPGSPAIDTGNNTAGAGDDQRGAEFPRVVGAAADIGAFEMNSDVIFVNGFN